MHVFISSQRETNRRGHSKPFISRVDGFIVRLDAEKPLLHLNLHDTKLMQALLLCQWRRVRLAANKARYSSDAHLFKSCCLHVIANREGIHTLEADAPFIGQHVAVSPPEKQQSGAEGSLSRRSDLL